MMASCFRFRKYHAFRKAASRAIGKIRLFDGPCDRRDESWQMERRLAQSASLNFGRRVEWIAGDICCSLAKASKARSRRSRDEILAAH